MPKTPKPDDIVPARRKPGYGNVTTDQGPWPEGGTILMRYEEACEREDCDPVLEAEKED